MAFNEFRPDLKDPASAQNLTSALKARLNEIDPRLGGYIQGNKLVVPLMDVQVATVSVALAADKKHVATITLTF